MSTVKIEAYATALFEIAQADGTLARVEDELFRVARAFESNEQLRNTLSDATIPADRRQQVAKLHDGRCRCSHRDRLSDLSIRSQRDD